MRSCVELPRPRKSLSSSCNLFSHLKKSSSSVRTNGRRTSLKTSFHRLHLDLRSFFSACRFSSTVDKKMPATEASVRNLSSRIETLSPEDFETASIRSAAPSYGEFTLDLGSFFLFFLFLFLLIQDCRFSRIIALFCYYSPWSAGLWFFNTVVACTWLITGSFGHTPNIVLIPEDGFGPPHGELWCPSLSA
jgi:hypothetical protein